MFTDILRPDMALAVSAILVFGFAASHSNQFTALQLNISKLRGDPLLWMRRRPRSGNWKVGHKRFGLPFSYAEVPETKEACVWEGRRAHFRH